jgi:hypothetical protein
VRAAVEEVEGRTGVALLSVHAFIQRKEIENIDVVLVIYITIIISVIVYTNPPSTIRKPVDEEHLLLCNARVLLSKRKKE